MLGLEIWVTRYNTWGPALLTLHHLCKAVHLRSVLAGRTLSVEPTKSIRTGRVGKSLQKSPEILPRNPATKLRKDINPIWAAISIQETQSHPPLLHSPSIVIFMSV